ncbi:MAG: uroporphyrinogen-III synthase [Chloroflexia bacterium]|nr:uroporphyrinogen-III synthase [Chloroflexia bacterium]
MSGPSSIQYRPLAGKRVLVTRPRHQASTLSDLLRKAGAIPVELPVIEIVPSSSAELDQALDQVGTYDWLVFTSVNAVAVVTGRLGDSRALRIAAIGDATAAALMERGFSVDVVPDQFVAEAVLDALIARGVTGKRFLLPRAEIARDILPDGLREAGAIVDVVSAYSTRLPEAVDQNVIDAILGDEIDIVTVTSPSTVRNLLTLTGGGLPPGIVLACIGPITAEAAQEAGLRVDIMASRYSIPGLVEALIQTGAHVESS